MRSCEYLLVSGPRRTKRLRLRNLRFFKGKRQLPQSSPFLRLADSISITFEFQKNDERDITVTMHRTGDPVLCPVIAWASVVQRIWSYKGTTFDTPVNTFLDTSGELVLLSSSSALSHLRAAVSALGKDELGYTADEMGTHSLRSGAAMAMYLAGVPVYTIMLIGRWSSDAFLRYIRRQVQEFSAGVSRRMILSPDFFTVPDQVQSLEDPRSSGNRHNFSGRGLIGLSSQSRALTPAFALHF